MSEENQKSVVCEELSDLKLFQGLAVNWSFRPEDGSMTVGAGLDELLGLERNSGSDEEFFWERIHPDDKEPLRAELASLPARVRRTIRFVGAGGESIETFLSAEAMADEQGGNVKLCGFIEDLSPHRARLQMESSPELFLAFAEHFPGAAFIKDADSRILYVNKYLREHFDASDWVGRKTEDLHEPDVARPLLSHDRLALDNGPLQIEEQVPDANGTTRFWRVHKFPIRRGKGENLLGAFAVDVTEERLAKQELEESRARYSAIVENFPNGSVILFDRDSRMIMVRGKGLERKGRKPEEFEGKKLHEVFEPEAADILETHQQAALEGRPSNYEFHYHGDWYEVWTMPVRDESGNIVGGLAMNQVVTDRLRAREMLHKREQEYRALVENAQDIICRFDRDGRVLYLNPAMEKITTMPSSWFLNTRLSDLHITHPQAHQFVSALESVFETGEERSIEISYSPKSGDKHFQVRLTPETDTEGDVETVLAVGREITRYKKLEAELRLAKEKAEKSSLAKSDFLANMSHEIRTPMNAMLGYIDLLDQEEAGGSRREYLDVIKGSAETLLTIIDDVLDYSKIEAGKLELEKTRFSPCETIRAVIREHSVLAEQKGIELKSECSASVPVELVGDSSRLKQVLRNLISNALKFTEEGEVRVNVDKDLKPAGNGRCRLLFQVEDTGIGLSPELRDKLFESFTQLDSGMRKKYKGTGLGLAICRRLVALHGGSIWVESESDRGSVFSFTAEFELPDETRPAPEKQPAEEPARAKLPPLSILLAEDNEINRTFLQEVLQDKGHSVTTAENGREALEVLRHGGFDVVLMDVQMPEMDGMEATRIIRDSDPSELDTDMPIIGLSAYAMKEYRRRFIQAGMDDFVSKPVNFDRLYAVIARLLGIETAVPEEEEPAKPAAGIVDRESIKSHYTGKGDVFSRLTGVLHDSLDRHLKTVERAVADRDSGLIEHVGHAICGSAASMGADALSTAASELEGAARREEWEKIPELYRRLSELVEPSIQALYDMSGSLSN